MHLAKKLRLDGGSIGTLGPKSWCFIFLLFHCLMVTSITEEFDIPKHHHKVVSSSPHHVNARNDEENTAPSRPHDSDGVEETIQLAKDAGSGSSSSDGANSDPLGMALYEKPPHISTRNENKLQSRTHNRGRCKRNVFLLHTRKNTTGTCRAVKPKPPVKVVQSPSLGTVEVNKSVDSKDVVVGAPTVEEDSEAAQSNKSFDGQADTTTTLQPPPDYDDDDIPSFEEWSKQKLEEQQRLKLDGNGGVVGVGDGQAANGASHPPRHTGFPSPSNGVNSGNKGGKRTNYASVECGAKVVAANTEAQQPGAVLVANRDEYMLNACKAKIWVIMELCEPVQVKGLDIANFELFSSMPERFNVSTSDRYPTREWHHLGTFHGRDVREVQSFQLDETMFSKFVKLEMLSHFGKEHYCPLTLFRIFGMSMVEEYDEYENSPSSPSRLLNPNTQSPPSSTQTVVDVAPPNDEEEDSAPTNLLGSAKDAVWSIMRTATKVWPLATDDDASVDNAGQSVVDEETGGLSYIYPQSQLPLLPIAMRCNMCLIEDDGHCVTPSICHYYHVMVSVVNDRGGDMKVGAGGRRVVAVALTRWGRLEKYLWRVRWVLGIYGVDSHNLPPARSINKNVTLPENVTSSDSNGTEKNVSSEILIKPQQLQINHTNVTDNETVSDQRHDSGEQNNATCNDSGSIIFPHATSAEGGDGTHAGHTQSTIPSSSSSSKESVFMRLNNRIKVLELNISLSSQYLENLSKRYKKQMENMQKQFNITFTKLTEASQLAKEKDVKQQESIGQLKDEISNLTSLINVLVEDRHSLNREIIERHLVLMFLEVLCLCVVFALCRSRTSSQPSLLTHTAVGTTSTSNITPLPTPHSTNLTTPRRQRTISGHKRHSSIDGSVGHRGRISPLQRRPSVEALLKVRHSSHWNHYDGSSVPVQYMQCEIGKDDENYINAVTCRKKTNSKKRKKKKNGFNSLSASSSSLASSQYDECGGGENSNTSAGILFDVDLGNKRLHNQQLHTFTKHPTTYQSGQSRHPDFCDRNFFHVLSSINSVDVK